MAGAAALYNPAALARNVEERAHIYGKIRFARARQNMLNNLFARAGSVA